MKINTKMAFSISILSCLFFFTSCKKYLSEKPDLSVSVPTTISDLQSLLDNTDKMNLQTTPSFGESSCDDYFLLDDTYNSFGYDGQQIYTWSRGVYNFQNDWSIAYETIYISNYCLEQINNISTTTDTKANWENVKGSALFYRSYNFLNLLWVYAPAFDENSSNTDLGIVLRLGADLNVASVRANVKECYDRVIEDAKESIEYLPNTPSHVMRPSKAAAYGLLSRTYLSMRDYDSSLKYSNLCLSLKNELIDLNGDNDINGSITATIPFEPYNKETIFYTEMTTVNAINIPLYAKIDSILYSNYDQNDLRKTAYFRSISNYFQFKGSYTGKRYIYFTGLATDEIYLIRAESNARLGNTDEAMNDLNTLMRKRWNNTVPFPQFTAINSDDALRQILIERRKELHMRGIRWIDIKRLNKEGKNILLSRKIDGQIYTLQPNSSYYALPLPDDIIKITGMPQN